MDINNDIIPLTDFKRQSFSTINYPIPAQEVIRRPSANASGNTLLVQQGLFDRAVSIALAYADYLAKEATKGNAPDGAREMLASQVRVRRENVTAAL